MNLDRYNFQGHLQMGNAWLEMGEAEKGLAAIRESVRLVPGAALPTCMLCFALVAAGQREEAEQVLTELKATSEQTYVKEYFLALACIALGKHDEALTYLEKSAAERDPWLVWFGTEPKLDVVRHDPRFVKLFRSTNNPLAF
jgi:tetratricopeptide (TPR) repeat protein